MKEFIQNPKNAKYIAIGIGAILLIGILFKEEDKKDPIQEAKVEHVVYKANILAFNSPSSLIDKLSGIGIGKLSPWRDLSGEYSSVSNDYVYGTGNSISIAANSKDFNYVHEIEIELYIANQSVFKQGSTRLLEVTEKIFKMIDETMPPELINAIYNKKSGEFKFKNGAVDILFEKGNNGTARYNVKIIEV